MRFLFRPPAAEATGLLTPALGPAAGRVGPGLLLEVPQRGISRHVVRFVASGGHVFALKEINERLARHEYRLLGEFEEEGLPTVSVLGICVDRPHDQEAILVTRYLEYSMSYRWLFSSPRGDHSAERLLDTLVELLVRLHLAGIFWGDCSLSNTLFRPDAGALAAYLVDAETVERHPDAVAGAAGLRRRPRPGAGRAPNSWTCSSAGCCPPTSTRSTWPRACAPRYEALWNEVTHEQVFGIDEQQWRIAERLQRLNDLGFDVGEVELITSDEGAKLRVETRVAEPGQHRRELFRLTGLEVQERQARRLLNDIRAFRARAGAEGGRRRCRESFAAHRWLAEVYQPVVDAIPPELVGRLAPAEVFHEVLEHRWFLSEQAQRDVGTAEATESYFATVLPRTPREVTTPSVIAGLAPDALTCGAARDGVSVR